MNKLFPRIYSIKYYLITLFFSDSKLTKRPKKLVGSSAFTTFEIYVESLLNRTEGLGETETECARRGLMESYGQCEKYFTCIRWVITRPSKNMAHPLVLQQAVVYRKGKHQMYWVQSIQLLRTFEDVGLMAVQNIPLYDLMVPNLGIKIVLSYLFSNGHQHWWALLTKCRIFSFKIGYLARLVFRAWNKAMLFFPANHPEICGAIHLSIELASRIWLSKPISSVSKCWPIITT